MTDQINLDENLIIKSLNENDYTFCTRLLVEEFTLSKNGEGRPIPKAPSISTLKTLNTILNKLFPFVESKDHSEDLLSLIRQCFLSLRNSAACGKVVQDTISNDTDILDISSNLLDLMIVDENNVYINVLKALLQFLSNLIVNNNEIRPKVIEKCFDSLNVALFNTDLSYVAAIIVYNLLKENTNLIKDDFDFVNNVIMLLNEEIENITLILELLIEKNIITNTLLDLDVENRLRFFEHLYAFQIDESIDIPTDLSKLLAEQFKRKSDCILKTVKDYLNKIEPLEVSRILDCLASFSSNEKHLVELQKDKSLLINCCFLLRSIHSAGKEGNNEFSAIQKLSDLKLLDDSVEKHPAFGFKANLIRLIGNLCWKHEENQNLVRELECIPLLLDCCNIDGRNPLIIQWVILAIRNLSENNDKNKSSIAEMTKLGVVDSATLREFGLTLNDDGDSKICIAPLNLNK